MKLVQDFFPVMILQPEQLHHRSDCIPLFVRALTCLKKKEKAQQAKALHQSNINTLKIAHWHNGRMSKTENGIKMQE